MGRGGKRVYVGNLPSDVREGDIRDFFRKYGKIVNMELFSKQNGPPFAFVEFDDSRDAEDAVHDRDGYDMDGNRVRVEFPREHRGSDGGRFVNSRSGGDRNYPSRNNSSRYGPPRRSKYRLLVSGLPKSGSWQDLKDHMREAGDVCYADVNKDGTGSVEFVRRDDMDYAIKKLDDTKFRSHEGETSYIRLKPAEGGRGGSHSRSRSRSPRSRSRTPVRAKRNDSPARGDDGAASDRDSKRKKEASRSRSRSAHSHSRSKTPASRSKSPA
ncbi:serine/arginine-rich splicing factor 1B-like [Paramacrobiotus metropolitanus]|uniref:serine/arginine-rich splicing factor 1B-like n=1 Tax=Paramacrobiotus metropolitanus TaxID=2943436 RepID=UPI0024457E3E|nr:serine/arginine-rich splicing factor 1B-like [Paramacrobiotus metropolitanus]